MQATTYTKTGTKAAAATKLSGAIFDIKVENHELLKSAYLAHQANTRENFAKTLKRGEVRGGGRKPWKQKGTGRARFGSIRVPIWRGGGITFGPSGLENYSRKIHVKAKRQAVRQALSLKAQAEALIVLESLDTSSLKVKDVAKVLNKVVTKGTSVLLVVPKLTPEIDRVTANISGVTVLGATHLNTKDILDAKTVVIVKDALADIENWLTTAKAETKKGDK